MAVKDSLKIPSQSVKRVAIIGGGASGAVTLDALVQEGAFDEITLFERRDQLGGIWSKDTNYGETKITPGLSSKELDPPLVIPQELSKKTKLTSERSKQLRFAEAPAIYKSLRTNIPQSIMAFSDNNKFPYLDRPGQDELTTLDSVHQYIDEYIGKNLSQKGVNLQLSTTIEKISKDDQGKFELIIRKEVGEVDEWSRETFDAVVVATGHYHVPYIPEVSGIHEVYERFPGKIIHAKGFDNADQFRDKKVIVIGGHSSSVDTVRELKLNGAQITWSVKVFDELHGSKVNETLRKPIITNYSIVDDQVVVKFLDGSELINPDKIIYATGYQFSYPFLQELDSQITDSTIVPNLYQHTFHINEPLLTFVGIPINAISFRAFEYQLILVSRFISGKVALPSREEQVKWRDQRLASRSPREYHRTDLDPAVNYLEELVQLGGGLLEIDGVGRRFQDIKEIDLELYENNKRNLHNKWAEL